MIGIAAVLGIMVALVGLAAATDRGVQERRRARRAYGDALLVMARFERSGGRVQELDHATKLVRRQMLRIALVPPAFAALALTLQQLLASPAWIAPLIVTAYVVVAAGFHWVVASIAGLADSEARRSGREVATGAVALLIKGFLVFAGILAAHQGALLLNHGIWLGGLAFAVLGVLIVTYSYIPAALVERIVRKRREVEFAQDAKTDAVLYLRSFTDDEFRLFSVLSPPGPRVRFLPGRVRFEEFLVSSLHGPSEIISVGRPGERLPALGASRTYWQEDDWRDAIRASATRVEALIVVAGRTASLTWELTQLRELGLLGKTLIIFPPDGGDATAERYSSISDVLGLRESRRLPAELYGALTAISFSRTGDLVHFLSCGRDWSSYVATTMYFFLVLSGEVRLDPEGSLTLVDELTDDPYFRAAHLFDDGREPAARAAIADAARLEETVSSVIGRAWAALELDQDSTRARELLTLARGRIVQFPGAEDHEPDLEEALAELDAVEQGLHPPRELLRQRYPRHWRRVNPIRSGRVRSGLGPGIRFIRAFQAIEQAEETDDYENALELAQQAIDVAGEASLRTLVALAQLKQAESLLALDRLDEAAAAYMSASRLRSAPRVSVFALLPSIDPLDIVDEALDGLCNVATKRDDQAERTRRLLDLRRFREEYRSTEDAAQSAIELSRAYGGSGRFKEARTWAQRSRQELQSIGHVDAAEAAYWCGMAELCSGEQEAALASFLCAAEEGQSSDARLLEQMARAQTGSLLVSAGRPSDACVEYARSLRLALEGDDISACQRLMDGLASCDAPQAYETLLSVGLCRPAQLGIKAAEALIALSLSSSREYPSALCRSAITGACEVLGRVPTEALVEHDGWVTLRRLSRRLSETGEGDRAAQSLEAFLQRWPAFTGLERETESDFGRRMLATEFRRLGRTSKEPVREGIADRDVKGTFDMWSDSARRVLHAADAAARSRHQTYLGTGHILFGLLDVDQNFAQHVLGELGLSLESVRERLDGTVGQGGEIASSPPKFTDRARLVIEFASREAERLHRDVIGTEHLLLALLREGEGAAASVLRELGADLHRARELLKRFYRDSRA